MPYFQIRVSTCASAVQPQHACFLEQLNREDWAYLEQLPFSITLSWCRVVITHAGLLPGVPLANQRLENLVDVWCLPVHIFLCAYIRLNANLAS